MAPHPPAVVLILVMLASAQPPRAAAADQGANDWDPAPVRPVADQAAALRDPRRVLDLVAAGRALFLGPFSRSDGVGRPSASGDVKPTRRLPAAAAADRLAGPDATACSGCHNRPVPGGSGDYSASVFVASATRYAVATPDHGNAQALRRAPSLLGAGLLELVAREITDDLLSQRDAALAAARRSGSDAPARLAAKGVDFGLLVARPDGSYDAAGLDGIDDDLVVRPFGWRGQAASLREQTITTLNQHFGIQAVERFGWERTGRVDFDDDGIEVELTPAQVSALTLFVASLPAPVPRAPHGSGEAATFARGRAAFQRAGCAGCHRPALPLHDATFSEPSPRNSPGTMRPQDLGGTLRLALGNGAAARGGASTVAAFTDLKRHCICDAADPFFCNEVSTRDGRPRGDFVTADLWAVGQGPPYGHHGGCATVSEAIVHHAGEAAPSRRAFLALPDDEKRDLVAFLLSLGAEATGRER
jgi:cytochrome c553